MTPSLPAVAARALFRAHEALLGRPTFRLLQSLDSLQWQGRERIDEYRRQRLNALLALALAHSPWHAARLREHGLEDAARGGRLRLEDLQRLPPMTREDARLNAEAMVWRGVPGGAWPYTTGGSSGAPLRFWFGRERQAADAACRMRARRWWGCEPGERECLLWGAPVELARSDRIRTVRDHLLNQLVLSAFAMSAPQMDAYTAAMQAWRPRIIYGYASSLALLAAHCRARGRPLRLPGLRVVCTTGEPLYPHQRSLIGEAFGAPVANEYGCRDGGLVAHESPAGQLLVNSDCLILESLDDAGAPVAAGVEGEATITHLGSAAQPFLRYRTGDRIRLDPARCLDGRGLEVLSEVLGRTTDLVFAADGTPMHALALIYVLREIPGVAEFRIEQHDRRNVTVSVVADAEWNADSGPARVARGLRARLGDAVRVEVQQVEAIPSTASGKHRYVISHVAQDAALKAAASAP